jgi:hypothetical protein
VLEVPAHYAFDFLADPSTARLIDPMIREYRPDTAPMGVGTRNVLRLRVWGVPLRSESIVEAWEPGVLMRMASTRPTRPVKVLAEHRFEPLGDERCRYTWMITCEPTVPGGRVVARLFGRLLAANADARQRESVARWSPVRSTQWSELFSTGWLPVWTTRLPRAR